MNRLPAPRGPLTECLCDVLRGPPRRLPELSGHLGDPLHDDAQLALYLLQELSYRPLGGVDPAWEEEPSARALRTRLEHRLEELLRAAVAVPTVTANDDPDVAAGEAVEALVELVERADGPSLSAWMAAHGTLDHLREFAVHRAAYQLKEADAHSTAIPRMAAGPAKAGLVAIQADEYGHGQGPGAAHAALFADTMAQLGLDPGAGPDLARLPAPTLATNTVLGLLATSRRLLPALLGHLAVFEMTSVEPMARYATTVRRLLPGPDGSRAARFYDVHVAADAHHQEVALDQMVRPYLAAEPAAAGDLLFGAGAVLLVERCFSEHLLERWMAGRTSLRAPLPGSELGGDDLALARAG